jgi:hypothetical protein
MKNQVIALIVASCLAGCATPPTAGLAGDLAFEVAPDKAGVYVFRTGTAGAAIRIGVELDGTPIGSHRCADARLSRDRTRAAHAQFGCAEPRHAAIRRRSRVKSVFIRQDFQLGYLQAHTRLLHRVPPSEGMLGCTPDLRQRSRASSA